MKSILSNIIEKSLKVFLVLTGIFCLLILQGSRVDASCIDISDVPLDVMQQEAPGIVMFVIDDSGSMDWSMVCPPPESQAVFDGNYYIFSNPGDNHYTSTYSQTLEGNSSDKMKWQSQWSGYNRIYYDPDAYYAPWPGKDNADINNPRSNPVNSSPTFNINGMWHEWGSGAGSITSQEIIDAGGVIVDNSDIGGSGDQIVELILDNEHYNNTNTSGSFSYTGDWQRRTDESNQRYMNSYFRMTEDSWSWWNRDPQDRSGVATWNFTNLVEDQYDVYIWYVDSYYNSSSVSFKVYDDSGDEVASTDVNQRNNGGNWVLIAENLSLPAGSANIVLDHSIDANQSRNRATADAVKLVRIIEGSGVPDKDFEADIPPWGTSSSGEQYGDDYLWTPTDGINYTATWTANILDPTITYDVYARWAGGAGYRSSSVGYTVTHDGGTTTESVDQNNNRGDWMPIAENVTFSGGTGVVELEHYRNHDYDRACADAVAFVPSQATASISNIARRHYYVQNENGTFLINLLNNNFEYYEVDLDNPGYEYEIVTEAKLTRLTLQEAEDAGIVTGRSYEQECQNFANWYSYYRRREHTAKNAIANVIDTMNGVYIGIIAINGNVEQRALPVRVMLDGVLHDESQTLLNALYDYDSGGSTPLRRGLKKAGDYFSGNYMKPGSFSPETSSSSYPYFIPEKGGTCQQSFAIVMSDGYWNGSSPGMGDEDGDGVSDTLADVAMYYYDNDLNEYLNDDVPITPRDQNNFQHMVTYSVSFGVNGALDPEDYQDCRTGDEQACPETWPNPHNSNSAKIDDMFHAAINGRGEYINANSPGELTGALQALKQDIESRLGSAASLATNSVERQVGTVLYQGTYNTANWFGDVEARSIDPESGYVTGTVWRASNHVPEWGQRNILSYDGSQGIEFDSGNLSATQVALLESTDLAAGVDSIVAFIKGDTSNNLNRGGPFRVRTNPIGDIVHSSPMYYRGTVYIGSNDGMLHAINATNGHERFCYVPNLVYGHLAELAMPDYSHRYYVDGTADAARVGTQHLLVSGLGKGGKGYFCLDITNPDSMGPGNVMWEYPSGADDDLGYTFSTPDIANTRAEGQVVIFGNGYDSENENAVLYVLDVSDGSVIKKFDTLAGNCNGLGTPSLVDVNADGYVDFAFAGDLKGNLWKFDLRGASSDDWKFYYQSGTTPMPLVTVKNSDGTAQPITVAPEVMLDCVRTYYGNGLMVIFGTGRYLTTDDLGDTTPHTFYGIWDWGDVWEAQYDHDTAKTKYLGDVLTDRSLSNIDNTVLLGQTVEYETDDWLVLSGNEIDYYNPSEETGQHMGWYFDLPVSGERCIRDPRLRMGVAVMVSTTPSESPCEAGGSSVIYQIDACTGGRTNGPQFDIDGDDIIDDDDLINGFPPTGKKTDSMLFSPIDMSDKLYFSTSDAGLEAVTVNPNPPGMLYWRLIQ